MTKRATQAARRRSVRQTAAPSATPHDAFPRPARIPGVHIAHIGGRSEVVEPIRAYWEARGAIFMHHSLEAPAHHRRLEEILELSHIVFHACAGSGCPFSPSLQRYCERAEKPLILLQENSVLALAEVLATGVPLP
jgi:hypothetical protein